MQELVTAQHTAQAAVAHAREELAAKQAAAAEAGAQMAALRQAVMEARVSTDELRTQLHAAKAEANAQAQVCPCIPLSSVYPLRMNRGTCVITFGQNP